VFITPKPVSVVDRLKIIELVPNNVSDLFRDLAGLDVAGVGVTQTRPIIRGQRGQRILLLEDGLRLNNSRRQQDFGEIPALVDISMVDRVEVVRGPASVLYGSDAIGGVVNVITQTPKSEGLHGTASYRFSTHDTQNKVAGSLLGRFGAFSFRGAGTYRNADPYDAPSGSYGEIRLNNETAVAGTGVQDESFNLYAAYDIARQQKVFAKYERYRADTTGFGFVDPAAYAPELPDILIDYPFQRFDKITMGYQGAGLGLPFADRLEIVGYYQNNERRFNLDVLVPDVPLGNPADPATPIVDIRTFSTNFTDLATVGTRIEASKFVGGRVMLTYGADFFNDDSNNNDSNLVEFGFPAPVGPVPVSADTVALVPNSSLQSIGVFVQGDVQLTDRASLILGVRFQNVHAETDAGSRLSDTDRTLVAAANGIYEITDNLAAVASVGRAFRAPNLVERFFNGPTPEGLAFQAANADLAPETSLNVDVGLRYRDRLLNLEGFVFRNEIRDG
jgi:hemoglobin/transferrin/lactoferrin receptor protein